MKMKTIMIPVCLFLIAGCFKMTVEEKEVQRIGSRDGRVEAVLITRDAGATTSAASHLFIVPKGGKVGKDDKAVFIADNVEGLRIQWAGDRHLTVEYQKARIFGFTNFWSSQRLDNFKYEVRITENQTEQRGAR
jgi:hypothetical protein